jgi:hypothetical protein
MFYVVCQSRMSESVVMVTAGKATTAVLCSPSLSPELMKTLLCFQAVFSIDILLDAVAKSFVTCYQRVYSTTFRLVLQVSLHSCTDI